jgi:hypothetical protein
MVLEKEVSVTEIIDEDKKWWNIPLIKEIFNNEVMSICSLAINPNRKQDKLVWVGTLNGDFSITSAYHFEKERAMLSKGRRVQVLK